MSQFSETLFLAGVRCDVPGCNVSIWRQGPSKETAAIAVLEAARAWKWTLALDRLQESRDVCPEHARAKAEAAEGMRW